MVYGQLRCCGKDFTSPGGFARHQQAIHKTPTPTRLAKPRKRATHSLKQQAKLIRRAEDLMLLKCDRCGTAITEELLERKKTEADLDQVADMAASAADEAVKCPGCNHDEFTRRCSHLYQVCTTGTTGTAGTVGTNTNAW